MNYPNPFSCKKNLELYYQADNRQALPIFLRIHTLFCSECRQIITRMEQISEEMLLFSEKEETPRLTNRVVRKVLTMETHHIRRRISLVKWGLPAFVLLTAMVLQVTADSIIWAKEEFGILLQLGLPIATGIALTAYTLFFVISHYSDILRVFNIDSTHDDTN